MSTNNLGNSLIRKDLLYNFKYDDVSGKHNGGVCLMKWIRYHFKPRIVHFEHPLLNLGQMVQALQKFQLL